MKTSGCNCANPLCLQTDDLAAGAVTTEHRPLSGSLAVIIGAALLFILGLVLRPLLQAHPSVYPVYSVYALFITAYILAGGSIIRQAGWNLLRGRALDEYFLMTAASIGAIAIGELPEAVAVMLFFRVGEYLEQAAVNRSRRSIAALMEVRPDYANLLDGSGSIKKVNPEQVRPGQVVLVRPGEKIPLDGEVLHGDSFVDSAALTGESVPLRVAPGDAVFAGAINGPGLLRVEVLKRFDETSLAKIFNLVTEAAGRKAKTEKFITSFARWYTPVVVLGALVLAVVPPLLLPGAVFGDWLYRSLVLLVISCPCALVISIPLGYFGGIGSASRHGILVKGSNFLEALLKVKTVVFDKTGTLTEGSFRLKEIIPQTDFERKDLLYWAAHAEAHSHHPIARSLREAYGDELRPERVTSYEERRGLGVKAHVDGRVVLAGNSVLLEREGVEHALCSAMGSVIYLAVGGRFAGCLVVGDEMKKDAPAAVGRLKELGVKQTVMLTGDGEAAAAEIATRAGVDRYIAGLLPGNKVARIEAMLAEPGAGRNGKLAFVGDGINDAPALTRADVGIAMGGIGSDAAVEAADIVIMDDRPGKVARAIEIAAFTRKVVVQNIILALGVKGFFVVMAILGAASIWEAVFADVGVALLAILNAARVFKK